MTYRVSYIDRSKDEFYPTEPAALARARELLEDVHCHSIVVFDHAGEPLGGVRLQLKLGMAME
jgi:hypothetical protein